MGVGVCAEVSVGRENTAGHSRSAGWVDSWRGGETGWEESWITIRYLVQLSMVISLQRPFLHYIVAGTNASLRTNASAWLCCVVRHGKGPWEECT